MDFKTMSKSRKRQMEQIFFSYFETNGGPKKHIRLPVVAKKRPQRSEKAFCPVSGDV
jgi:hypothetical protein